MTYPRVVKLTAWAPVLDGEGSELVLSLEAFKDTKVATRWRGRISLKVDRSFVRQLAQAIEQMQKRDRERLDRERERLAYEVAPVQITQPKEPT